MFIYKCRNVKMNEIKLVRLVSVGNTPICYSRVVVACQEEFTKLCV